MNQILTKCISIFLFFGVFLSSNLFASPYMCDVIHEEGQMSLLQAFAKINRNLMSSGQVDLTFSGCTSQGDTTWGLIEQNNFPTSFPDSELVFMIFDGISEKNQDHYEFKLLRADGPYLDGRVWVSISTGEVIFP